ncbi:DNA cytosine methyltransferase [Dactylosporangium roseum]|uniref:Cytosine-specific methyltransferase n=1 Tax=Dactylosporangium roseum TaxID=47989 RepID=A0ABY5Z7Q3_9ACTN|nr:DNA cytosine methyltransferase [Dactylosporangium roseum]UWZ37035.1 DNA cytosine methyltransferase [Dactylosporangium roseum]
MAMHGVAISLFAGAGGLDEGAEQAGYQVRAAVEWDRDAAATMEKNFDHLHSPVINRSIVEVTTEEILTAAGLAASERPDLLIGGPPCTPFSKSGFWLEWKRQGLDPTASLLQEYTRVLREAQPDRFVLENVYALTYNNTASRPAYERLLREIDEAGYDAVPKVLNAADYGVPQSRPRLFILGVRRKSKLPLPEHPAATHGGQWERRATGVVARPHVTAGEALLGVISEPEPSEQVGGKYGHLLPDIPPGDNYLFYTEQRGHPNPQFRWRSKYWSFLLKLSPDRPSPTVQAQPGPYIGPFHWENRRLRVNELKRLFTFRDNFEFVGSRSSVQAQIGNCVPPRLARQVVAAFHPDDPRNDDAPVAEH